MTIMILIQYWISPVVWSQNLSFTLLHFLYILCILYLYLYALIDIEEVVNTKRSLSPVFNVQVKLVFDETKMHKKKFVVRKKYSKHRKKLQKGLYKHHLLKCVLHWLCYMISYIKSLNYSCFIVMDWSATT